MNHPIVFVTFVVVFCCLTGREKVQAQQTTFSKQTYFRSTNCTSPFAYLWSAGFCENTFLCQPTGDESKVCEHNKDDYPRQPIPSLPFVQYTYEGTMCSGNPIVITAFAPEYVPVDVCTPVNETHYNVMQCLDGIIHYTTCSDPICTKDCVFNNNAPCRASDDSKCFSIERCYTGNSTHLSAITFILIMCVIGTLF